MDSAVTDPKGLIRESYRMPGITTEECRSIFLDWALSLPDGVDVGGAIDALLAGYGSDRPDHPMNAVLQAGLAAKATPKRRGGRAARVPSEE